MDRDKVKKWYDWGIWTDTMVATAVKKGELTAEDYLYITGKEYTE